MKRLVAVAVLASAHGFVLPGSAHAAPTGPVCATVSVAFGPAAPAKRHDAVLMGGPLVGTGTLRCSLQAGIGTPHSASDLAAASSSNATVVTVNPRTVSFLLSGGELSLCSQWTSARGTTYYLDPGRNLWSTDAQVPCQMLADVSTWRTWPKVEQAARVAKAAVDSALCPLIPLIIDGELLGGLVKFDDGDVYVAGRLVYDCTNGTLPADLSSLPDLDLFLGGAVAPVRVRRG